MMDSLGQILELAKSAKAASTIFGESAQPWILICTNVLKYVCAANCLCLTPLRDEQWSEHLEYLPHFFKHPQCVLIRGCPVFFAYRTGHMKAQASPMLELWYKLAPQNGFSGMETRGGFQHVDHVDGPTLDPHIKGSFHFGPSFCYNRWANHWREAAGG